tara:strand:- start:7 stop:666 length:660 start_codon:yes stop_codon:yes gene_type:complete
MKIKKIESFESYAKSKFGRDENNYIESINSRFEEKSLGNSDASTFQLNPEKTNKNRFYFENLNYKKELVDYIKKGKYLILSLVIALVVVFILNFLVDKIPALRTIGLMIAGVFLLGWIAKSYGYILHILNFPKYLIIKNGYIKESSPFFRDSNNFFFNEIKFNEFNNFKYFYFLKKGNLIEESLIFYSDNENESLELETFIKKYANISHEISLNKYIQK